jgi:Acyl-CoA synthetases (AMP-forming)/AMP-acid ligases II
MSNHLYQAIEQSLLGKPDKEIICWEGSWISAGELVKNVHRMASCLERLGVHSGARVSAQIEKHPANIILYLAVLRLDAIFLPLNTAYTRQELAYFLSDASPVLHVGREEKDGDVVKDLPPPA